MFYPIKNKLAVVAIMTGFAICQAASAATMNFDSQAAGTEAKMDPVAISMGITFDNAALLPNLDADGIAIPGSEHWQIDSTTNELVTAENTSAQGYGVAPSGQNALDARWSPILMHFNSAINLANFSVTLPNSTYGNLAQVDILFFDNTGATLFDLGYFQGQPLATISLNSKLNGVKDILLPSGTFYDNISVAAVPVPSALWLFGSAVLGMAGLRRRKV
jgi:hypothetical protein